jgi:hypothetical protein
MALTKNDLEQIGEMFDKRISSFENKQEFVIKEGLLELETKLSERISILEKKQDMESFQIKTNMEYLTMRANLSGSSTERVQRSPSGNGLLEPKDSWGRRPLYNR